ncbi:hypothetical protein ANANG_G00269070 [Anguilla anguilla]|uniref:Interleukin-7 receptor subunit alpha n=1 Tax=Anguilla anguilla TaxID=7936 RepID=A0A9D3LYR1_ANGAN|nr:hypothetical protein ANANG_G00269070 [Anguilla anguilla]
MGCWPWALLLPLMARAQSGTDGVDCSSHISVKHENTLTCQFEDEDDVANISLCTLPDRPCKIGQLKENRVIFQDLEVLKKYQLRIQWVEGEPTHIKYDLRSIIKPTAPWIINATFLEKSGTVPIYIGTQYHLDFLDGKLMFDLDIASAENTGLRTEVPYSFVIIERSHLRYNTNYSVRVRAKPHRDYFKGTWSDWSPSVSFQTPTLHDPADSFLVYTLIAAAIILLLIITIAILRWHNVIKSCIWPRIPNPKNTFLQMYKPNKALPISFNPEVFSDHIIHLVDHIEAKGIELEIRGGGWGICEVRGREREGLTAWNPGDLEGSSFPLKLSTGETDGGVTQTTSLLNGVGGVRASSWPKTPSAPPAGRREEPYITMSSFFNTE